MPPLNLSGSKQLTSDRSLRRNGCCSVPAGHRTPRGFPISPSAPGTLLLEIQPPSCAETNSQATVPVMCPQQLQVRLLQPTTRCTRRRTVQGSRARSAGGGGLQPPASARSQLRPLSCSINPHTADSQAK